MRGSCLLSTSGPPLASEVTLGRPPPFVEAPSLKLKVTRLNQITPGLPVSSGISALALSDSALRPRRLLSFIG